MPSTCFFKEPERESALETGVRLSDLEETAVIDGVDHFIACKGSNLLQTIFRDSSTGDIVTTLMAVYREQNPQKMECLVISRVPVTSEYHEYLSNILEEVNL